MENFQTEKKTRVRFAPSPTGYLHVGGLRTALYNYLFAKKTGGAFILRLEDTDRKRYVDGSVENLVQMLQKIGLNYEEGVFFRSADLDNDKTAKESSSYPGMFEKGEYGPYIQSENLKVYQKYALDLIEKGYAYYCFCDSERLEKMRAEQKIAGQAPMYDRHCLLTVTSEEAKEKIKSGAKYVIRLKVPRDKTIVFNDIVRGRVSIESNTIDDQVLIKSDGFPTYQLANVVDDHSMRITHVIRGEEWLSSTPKHILLYRAFDWDIPEFAHLPLLLSADKKKLSKRMGDVAVEDYLRKGYLREAVINFVAFLGWNPGQGNTQEIFSMEELISKFELKKIHKGGAVFDLKKLDWLNAQYIKKISLEELLPLAKNYLQDKDFYRYWLEKNKDMSEKEKDAYLKKVLSVEQERLSNLLSIGEGNKFFFQEPEYSKDLLTWKNMLAEDLKNSLEKSQKTLSEIDENDWTRENLEKVLLETAGEKRGELLWPLRAALTGEQKSPGPVETAWVLGKQKSLERLNAAINKCR